MVTNKHLLIMTSRLDDYTDDVDPANIKHNANAGTQYAYLNVCVKLRDVIAQGSGQTWNTTGILRMGAVANLNNPTFPLSDYGKTL